MEHPDNKYLNALLTNNEELLKEFYQRCFGKIKNFVLRNNGTADDAWDILQDAMLSVYYKLKQHSFTLSCPFDAFIFIVCRNLWIKFLRNNSVKGVTIPMEKVSFDIPAEDATLAEGCRQNAERKKLLDEKLLLLGDGCQQLLMQSWQGRHIADIAEDLKITYGYARKKKTECMAKLVLLMKQSPAYSLLK